MATETFGSTTIISDPGATANSYISVADAKAYYDFDPNKDYSAIDDETLAKALITATMLADAYYGDKYKGYLYDSAYALFWPRTSVTDQRGVVISDYTTFPTQLGWAIAEQAYYGATEDREAEPVIDAVTMERVEGAVTVQYSDVSDKRIAASKPLFVSRAQQLMSPFVIGGGSGMVQVMSRG